MFAFRRRSNDLYELTSHGKDSLRGSPYYNEDLAPTDVSKRTWGTYHMASLWMGMAICIPTYQLASSFIAMGFSWLLSIGVIVFGCLIILIPIQLNSHAGTKYGIPYPVFSRPSFGIRGAQFPSLVRSFIATAWVSVQVWIGGSAINTALAMIFPAWAEFSAGIWVCYFGFFFLNFLITYRGSEAIKKMESIGAPLLVLLALALLIWAFMAMKDAGQPLSAALIVPESHPENFLVNLLASLSAVLAFWATMSLNVPDFSRYAKNQKCAWRGLLFGMPLTMLAFSMLGIFVTGVTIVIYGEALWNPVDVIARIGSPVAAFLSCIGIAVATLTTNVACNILGPANGYSNLFPEKISYKKGVLIVAAIAICIPAWKVLADPSGFVMNWLGTIAIFTGGFGGIYVADYYLVRKKRIDLQSVFQGKEGRYWYEDGVNRVAVLSWFIASVLPIIGIFVPSLNIFRVNGWILSYVLALIIYFVLMKNKTKSMISETQFEKMLEPETQATETIGEENEDE